MPNIFALTQARWRIYADDGSETTSTPLNGENANVTLAPGVTYHLRIGLDETGAGSIAGATTDDYQLQYSKNGGGFTNVTGASSNVIGVNSANLTDAGTTTQRLSAGGGSFVAGEIAEDGLLDDRQVTANNFTEFLYAIQIVGADVAEGDTLDFRVLLNGATTNMTYSVTPRLTATKVPYMPKAALSETTPRLEGSVRAAVLAAMVVGNLLTSTLAPEPVVDPVATTDQVTLIGGKQPTPRWLAPNLLTTTLDVVAPADAPFAVSRWQTPRSLARPQQDVGRNVLAATTAPAPETRDPLGTGQYTVIAGKRAAPLWRVPNLLGSTLAAAPPSDPPFAQSRWPNPRTTRGSVLVTTITQPGEVPEPPAPQGDPFAQTSWPNPRVKKAPALTWLQGDILKQLIPYHPIGVEWTNPPLARRAPQRVEAPNLLGTTLASAPVQSPFVPTSWPTPSRRVVAVPFDAPALLNGTLAVAPIHNPFTVARWVVPASKSVAQQPIPLQNIQIGTLSLPGPTSQTDWPLPQVGKRHPVSFTQARPTYYTEPDPGVPFAQTHWPLPVLKRTLALTWTQPRPQYYTEPAAGTPFTQGQWPNPLRKATFARDETPNIQIGTLALPGPTRQSEWPTPAQAKRLALTWAQNLQQSTLAPVVVPDAPFTQSAWPNPSAARVVQPAAFQRTIDPQAPFNQSTWPTPASTVRAIRVETQNLLALVAPVTDPFGQANWPIPTRKRPIALTWTQGRPTYYVEPPVGQPAPLCFQSYWPNPVLRVRKAQIIEPPNRLGPMTVSQVVARTRLVGTSAMRTEIVGTTASRTVITGTIDT